MNAPTNIVQTSPSRRLGLLLAALIAALLAVFALVLVANQNAAQAHEEFTRQVPAGKGIPGYETGIYIHQGERVVITATGTVDLDAPHVNGDTYNNVPPNGIAGTAPAGDAFVLPSAPIGALLGNIGGFPVLPGHGGFLVDDYKAIPSAQKSGELYLIVNDTEFSDNAGSFTAQVAVYPPADTRHPRVISTVPTAGATGVAPTAKVKAFFSEDMKAYTINGSTFKLFREGSATKVDAIVSYNATMDKAVLNPDKALRSGVTYKAVVTTHAKDKAGNHLDQRRDLSGLQQKVWYFKVSS
jgi:hypothetical protein